MHFGQKLVELRKEKDLTQAEVGKTVGVHERHVSSWENARSNPSLENVIALAKLFDVSIDYLVFDNVPREGVAAINDLELYEYFQKADALPKEKKEMIKEFLDAIVLKQKLQEMPEAGFSRAAKETAKNPLRKIAGKR